MLPLLSVKIHLNNALPFVPCFLINLVICTYIHFFYLIFSSSESLIFVSPIFDLQSTFIHFISVDLVQL